MNWHWHREASRPMPACPHEHARRREALRPMLTCSGATLLPRSLLVSTRARNTPCRKVRACSHKTDSRRKRRATNPRTGGRPTPDLAGNDPRTAGHRYFLTSAVSSCPAGTTPWNLSEVSSLWSTSPWPRSVHISALHRVRGRWCGFAGCPLSRLCRLLGCHNGNWST